MESAKVGLKLTQGSVVVNTSRFPPFYNKRHQFLGATAGMVNHNCLPQVTSYGHHSKFPKASLISLAAFHLLHLFHIFHLGITRDPMSLASHSNCGNSFKLLQTKTNVYFSPIQTVLTVER